MKMTELMEKLYEAIDKLECLSYEMFDTREIGNNLSEYIRTFCEINELEGAIHRNGATIPNEVFSRINAALLAAEENAEREYEYARRITEAALADTLCLFGLWPQ